MNPLLRDVIEQTDHSRWLRTEFSRSGLPADHARDSDGIPLKRSRSWPPTSALPGVSAVRKVGLPLTERLSKLRLTERPKKSTIRKTLDQTEAASAERHPRRRATYPASGTASHHASNLRNRRLVLRRFALRRTLFLILPVLAGGIHPGCRSISRSLDVT